MIFDDQEFLKLKSEVIELQSTLKSKEKLIDFLSSRLEKVKSTTQGFI